MVPIATSDCIFWQDLKRSEKIAKFLDTGLLADCKFIVGPNDETAETIFGHKVFFVLESPVLERMLTDDKFVEVGKNSQIRIEDIEPHDFKNFRNIIYNSMKISQLSISEIIILYGICRKYMITRIANKCIDYLVSVLGVQSLNGLITLFDFSCGLEDKCLKTEIEKKISARNDRISENLNELSPEVFYEYILFMTKLNTASKIIFDTIENYLKNNRFLEKEHKISVPEIENKIVVVQSKETTENNRVTKKENVEDKFKVTETKGENVNLKDNEMDDFKRNLLKLVNFDGMTIKEFMSGPGQSDLLKAQQKYDILAYLCLKRFI